ncbi:YceD family protein [Gulosibacter faecalis]|jgi:uncharacterized protein|uniref:YceD family protein n=1 Tax=Gulosibacter faecalis TaxID=272240 RepID=A0ABW5UX00_9MICO|nr:DUF177 domain-containing protein [Gulosibacter faecalis]
MAASPYEVNVATIMHKPGSMREFELDVTVPERIGEGMLYFDKGAELEVDLKLETLVDGILATADVRGTLTGNCSRCLTPLEEDWSGHVAEMFGYQADESLEYALDGDMINLEGPIRDAVVLDLPFQPLCEPDCLGLDPATGERLTEPLPEDDEPIDPRWAQLEQLLRDDAESGSSESK